MSPPVAIDESEDGVKYLRNVGVAALALVVCLSACAGAWGEGPFDNDDAQDWLAECSRGDASVSQAIETVLRPGYLEIDVGSAAVAAAEVVAIANGKGTAATHAGAAPCLAKSHAADVRALAPRARQALARVSDPKFSELAQSWADGKANRWAEHITQLAMRLQR